VRRPSRAGIAILGSAALGPQAHGLRRPSKPPRPTVQASGGAALAHGRCRLTERLQLAGAMIKEEIHLRGDQGVARS
jgi:hypothetical protein